METAKCGEIFVSESKKFTFSCDICNQKFEKFECYQTHIEEEHIQEIFKNLSPSINKFLNINDKKTISVTYVDSMQHSDLSLGEINEMQCTNCDKTFDNLENFNRHKNGHYCGKCPLCGDKSFSNIYRHVSKHHKHLQPRSARRGEPCFNRKSCQIIPKNVHDTDFRSASLCESVVDSTYPASKIRKEVENQQNDHTNNSGQDNYSTIGTDIKLESQETNEFDLNFENSMDLQCINCDKFFDNLEDLAHHTNGSYCGKCSLCGDKSFSNIYRHVSQHHKHLQPSTNEELRFSRKAGQIISKNVNPKNVDNIDCISAGNIESDIESTDIDFKGEQNANNKQIYKGSKNFAKESSTTNTYLNSMLESEKAQCFEENFEPNHLQCKNCDKIFKSLEDVNRHRRGQVCGKCHLCNEKSFSNIYRHISKYHKHIQPKNARGGGFRFDRKTGQIIPKSVNSSKLKDFGMISTTDHAPDTQSTDTSSKIGNKLGNKQNGDNHVNEMLSLNRKTDLIISESANYPQHFQDTDFISTEDVESDIESSSICDIACRVETKEKEKQNYESSFSGESTEIIPKRVNPINNQNTNFKATDNEQNVGKKENRGNDEGFNNFGERNNSSSETVNKDLESGNSENFVLHCGKSQNLQCSNCDKIFHILVDLNRHKRAQICGRCPLCNGKSFSNIYRHVSKHHKDLQPRNARRGELCFNRKTGQIIPKSIYFENSHKNIELVSAGEIETDIQLMEFEKGVENSQHSGSIFEKVNDLQCLNCDKIFSDLEDFTNHKKRQVCGKCPLCNEMSFSNIYRHVSTHHKHLQPSNATRGELCFNRKTGQIIPKSVYFVNLRDTEKVPSGDNIPKTASTTTAQKVKKGLNLQQSDLTLEKLNELQCKNCDKIFNNQETFNRHEKRQICGKCPLCNEISFSNIYRHVSTHHKHSHVKNTKGGRLCFNRKTGKIIPKLIYYENYEEMFHSKLSGTNCKCGIEFESIEECLEHVAIKKVLCCKTCNTYFADKNEYIDHMNIHNAKQRTKKIHNKILEDKNESTNLEMFEFMALQTLLKCNYCKKTFQAKQIYLEHIQSKNCQDLSEEMMHEKELVKINVDPLSSGSAQIIEDINVKKCSRCLTDFRNIRELKFHRNHAKCGKCCVCKTSFDDILRHIKDIHKEIEYKYKNDKRSFYDRATGNLIYEETENVLECNQCFRVFQTKKTLINHVLAHRLKPEAKCNICGKIFNQKFNLNIHKKIHSTERPYKCSHCNLAFKTKAYLKSHVIAKHTGKRTIKCSYADCEKYFKTNCAKNFHEKYNHSGLKNHLCFRCGSSFKTSSALRKHNIVHHTDKKYWDHKCDYCEKKFHVKEKLIAHINKHKGEKPFKCKLCSKAYAAKRHLRRHIKDYHTPEESNVRC